MIENSKKSSGALLIFVGLYFIFQFLDLKTNIQIVGFLISLFIIFLGLYNILKRKIDN